MRQLESLLSAGFCYVDAQVGHPALHKWSETGLRVQKVQMKVLVVLVLLFSASWCAAQTRVSPAVDADTRGSWPRLSPRLQNPWRGWRAGTEITLRYMVERDAAGKPLGKNSPTWCSKSLRLIGFSKSLKW